jgi:ketosteroid isomerase-like protein
MMTTQHADLHGEAEVLRIIADQQKAVCAKDIDRIMSHYAAEFCVFNVKPPFQIRAATDWRRVWETSLAHFPPSFGMETRDLVITMSGELAVAHYLSRFTGLPGDPFWIRVTAVYRLMEGTWKIVHEHSSVPFDPETSRVVSTPED